MRKLIAILLLVAAGCSGDGLPPAPQAQTNFEFFVRDQLAATADDTEPVDVNAIDFINLLFGDENAFADLFR